jgi:hypothetical protein
MVDIRSSPLSGTNDRNQDFYRCTFLCTVEMEFFGTVKLIALTMDFRLFLRVQ